jgi:hypothetical protein
MITQLGIEEASSNGSSDDSEHSDDTETSNETDFIQKNEEGVE